MISSESMSLMKDFIQDYNEQTQGEKTSIAMLVNCIGCFLNSIVPRDWNGDLDDESKIIDNDDGSKTYILQFYYNDYKYFTLQITSNYDYLSVYLLNEKYDIVPLFKTYDIINGFCVGQEKIDVFFNSTIKHMIKNLNDTTNVLKSLLEE